MPGLALLVAIALLPAAPAAGADLPPSTVLAARHSIPNAAPPVPGPPRPIGATRAQAGPRDAWFAEDKLQHFFVSFALTGFGHAGARLAGLDRRPALAAGVAGSFAAGLAKEIRDSRRPGDLFSFKDLAWDLLGIGVAAAVLAGVR